MMPASAQGRTAAVTAALVLALLAATGGRAPAQDLGLGAGSGDLPIEITADDGIEWQQERSVVRARGNAKAIRGDVEVRADTLSAFYREDAAGDTEVWRLEADGRVEITAPEEQAFADKGTYDVGQAVLVLSGTQPVRLVGKDGEITAHRQVEYWEQKKILVARGDASARQGENTVGAEVLVAYFQAGTNGEQKVDRVEAFDDVHIATPQEDAWADRGVYHVDSGIATLLGTVRIARGPNRLNGCRAEINLNTGVSKLFGCDGKAGGKGQVEGLVHPDAPKKK